MAGWKGKEFDVPSLDPCCFYWLFEIFGSVDLSIAMQLRSFTPTITIYFELWASLQFWLLPLYLHYQFRKCLCFFPSMFIIAAGPTSKVWNTRPGGIVVCAPPCSTWIFLSTSVTGRSWSQPGGNGSRCTLVANIFIRRMLYMLPGCMQHVSHW